MRTTFRYAMIGAALTGLSLAAAQEPLRATPSLQERIVALEANVAAIETRFGLQSTRPSNLGTGESGLALTARLDALERSFERLASDLQRIERLADGAARDAAQAQRAATAAEQTARDALLRSR